VNLGNGNLTLQLHMLQWTQGDGNSSAHQNNPQTCSLEYPGGYRYYDLDTGSIENDTFEFKLLYSTELCAPESEAIPRMICFRGTRLGEGSFIRLRNPSRQDLFEDAHALLPSQKVDFTLGGKSVLVELWGAPRTKNRIRINYLHWVRYTPLIEPADSCGICCGSDNRFPANAPFVGRLVLPLINGGVRYCTAFLAYYAYNNCVLMFSAGHCLDNALLEDTWIEFNVPPSIWQGGTCQPVSPSQEHRFEIVNWSYEKNGVGNDWAVIRPGMNNEGLTPYQKYNDSRLINSDIGEHLLWNPVHKFGYGADDKPMQCERHLAQQYAAGRIVSYSTSAPYTVDYTTDLRPADSGAPVILSSDLTVIGIVTHCRPGCPNIAQRFDDYRILEAYWDLCQCLGDVNSDRIVDDADLLAVLLRLGSSCWGCPEDVNRDGQVDDTDLILVLFNFGPCD
jgi:hypothetical protein